MGGSPYQAPVQFQRRLAVVYVQVFEAGPV